MLTGKYLPGQKAPAGSRATDKKGGANMISKFMTEPILTAAQKLLPIAKKVDLTPAHLQLLGCYKTQMFQVQLLGQQSLLKLKKM